MSSQCSRQSDYYQCNLCGTVFEKGVADPGSAGEVRCPQCLLCETRRIEVIDEEQFVVTRRTKFR